MQVQKRIWCRDLNIFFKLILLRIAKQICNSTQVFIYFISVIGEIMNPEYIVGFRLTETSPDLNSDLICLFSGQPGLHHFPFPTGLPNQDG